MYVLQPLPRWPRYDVSTETGDIHVKVEGEDMCAKFKSVTYRVCGRSPQTKKIWPMSLNYGSTRRRQLMSKIFDFGQWPLGHFGQFYNSTRKSTFYFPLSIFHFPLSTFQFLLSTFYFLLSTFYILLSKCIHPLMKKNLANVAKLQFYKEKTAHVQQF